MLLSTKQCFQNYTLDDGLACNQFYWNAAYKGRNGELYFGNMTGLSVVSPASQPSILQKKFPVVFTHCQTLQGEVQVKDGVVEIHEREKFISIEFATLDYNVTPQAAYAYRLKGFNDQWTITGKRQPYHIIRQPSTGSIRLGSTVRHRRYTLRIRFGRKDGIAHHSLLFQNRMVQNHKLPVPYPNPIPYIYVARTNAKATKERITPESRITHTETENTN